MQSNYLLLPMLPPPPLLLLLSSATQANPWDKAPVASHRSRQGEYRMAGGVSRAPPEA